MTTFISIPRCFTCQGWTTPGTWINTAAARSSFVQGREPGRTTHWPMFSPCSRYWRRSWCRPGLTCGAMTLTTIGPGGASSYLTFYRRLSQVETPVRKLKEPLYEFFSRQFRISNAWIMAHHPIGCTKGVGISKETFNISEYLWLLCYILTE